MRRLLAVFLTLGVAALAACGGGPSKSSFITEADDTCRTANAPVASLKAPATFGELADGAGKLAAAGDDQVPELRELDRPDGAREETDAVFSSIAATGIAARSLKDAADKRDKRATALAAVDLSAKARQGGDAARTYGFATCGVSTQTAATALTDGAKNVLKTSFVSKVEDLCRAAEDRVDDLSVGSISQVLRAIDTLVSTYGRLKTDIAALVAPPGDEPIVNEYLDATQKLVDKLREFKDAAAAGNPGLVEALAGDLDSLTTQANAKADAYGLRACGTLSGL